MAEQELDLIAAIRAEPDLLDGYVVYGDWLAERGDPRGELIGLAAGLARRPDDRKLARQLDKLQRAALARLPARDHMRVTWRLGFVESIEITRDVEADALAALMQHPACALVRSISLRSRRPVEDVVTALVAHVPPALLRSVGLGSRTTRITPADVDRLLAQFPQLAELALRTRSLHDPIGGQLPARVRALSFDVQRATVEGIEAIARARWPALASLTIASMSGIDEWPAPSPLAPLLAGTAAPRLTELRVVEANPSELTDRLAAEILRSALLPRLTALDFAFDRVDIEALRAEYPRFAHVGSLFASAERCTDADTLGSYVWFLDELDPPRAAALAARGVRHADTDFDRHSIGKQHGAALSMIGDHAGAIAALRASLALDNDCGMTWLHMAIAQKRAGNLVEAEAAIALAVAATKHTAERRSLVFHQASIAAARRGVAAVREQLEEARLLFTLDDIDADVLYERACLLALLDDRPAALAALAACLARCPHYRLHAGTELDFASLRDTGELAELLGLSQ